MADDKLKSGQPAPSKGEYREVGPRGGKTDNVVSMDKDETMPPTTKPNHSFVKE